MDPITRNIGPNTKNDKSDTHSALGPFSEVGENLKNSYFVNDLTCNIIENKRYGNAKKEIIVTERCIVEFFETVKATVYIGSDPNGT